MDQDQASNITRDIQHSITLAMATLTMLLFSACTLSHTTAFDPKTCLETIPHRVDGLQILAGPRTEPNIIRGMRPAICHGQALFNNMQPRDPYLSPGTVRFRVVVEYTGEVSEVTIMESSISSKTFLREVRDFIMDTDFTGWARSDEDSVFLYPARFGS
jgi:hypothetical protein